MKHLKKFENIGGDYYDEDDKSKGYIDYANVLSLSLARKLNVKSDEIFDWFMDNKEKVLDIPK